MLLHEIDFFLVLSKRRPFHVPVVTYRETFTSPENGHTKPGRTTPARTTDEPRRRCAGHGDVWMYGERLRFVVFHLLPDDVVVMRGPRADHIELVMCTNGALT
ncbi:hypothetical protein N7462_003196 [Penicillium macrosclerotiorum]|uniref:uncharacterized protein n=1 Tax=Penicillium macrosclerotiorum TaxID=303699 RepID=UPI002547EF31|nr:uncharacterized protein N7462_003196 [Penicillium macrosclerotiorum]KAJ5688804.1 hypothetical protein N7462_003196 [Penicillium macrosclerotiorum]